MRAKIIWVVAVLCVVGAVLLAVKSNKNAGAAGDMPPGHGITCLKADGSTPCGDPEVSDLNGLISGVQKAVAAAQAAKDKAQGVVAEAKQAGSDAKQLGSDGKQLGSDAKQLGTDAKNKDLKKGVGDAQQAGNDAGTATGDAQQATGDAQQAAKDLKGIKTLSLRSSDGALSCLQDTGAACSDGQTKALQIHAAQLQPQINVKREVDQASN